MEIIWLPIARQDILFIKEYLSQDDFEMAHTIVARIIQSVNILANSPGIGRPGRIKKTREMVLKDIPYIIPYRVQDSKVQVLRVFHQSRKWPNSF